MSKQGILLSIPENQEGDFPKLITDDDGMPVGGDPAAFDRVVASLDDSFETSQEGNTAVKVFIQDQTSPALLIKANKVLASSTLATPTVIGERTCTVASSTGMTVGNMLIATSVVGHRYYFGDILAIDGDDIEVDTPFDYAYEAGQQADATTTDMSVDGSVTPQVFGLRVAEPPSGIDVAIDVTRLIFACSTENAVDLSKFGDIVGGLTRGLVVRHRNNTFMNIFNVKTNGDIAALMYDWTPYAATNPVQGQNGFSARMSFAGQDKVGVTIRVEKLEDLEFIIQDDLSTIENLQITIEGHVVV